MDDMIRVEFERSVAEARLELLREVLPLCEGSNARLVEQEITAITRALARPEEGEAALIGKRLHKCVACGKIDVWGDGWMSRAKPQTRRERERGYDPDEECSCCGECRSALDAQQKGASDE